MVSPLHPLTHWWYTAQAEEIGIAIKTSNRDRTRADLYKARAEAADESLQELSLVIPPGTDNVIWIIKNGKHNGKV